MAEVSDGRVAAGGVTLAYTLTGSGPPVVLLHGWCGDRAFWRQQAASLSQRYRVLSLDFRGHGDSEAPPDGYTLAQLAVDVVTATRALGHSPAAVVGHSMGGMVAQRLAVNHPTSVSALALVATAAADPDDALISARILDDAPLSGYREAFERHSPRWFAADADPTIKEWALSRMRRVPERVALELVGDYRGLDFRAEMPSIEAPTLVIGATADVSTRAERSEEIATAIPGAKLVLVESAGHFVQLERPAEVTGALTEFLGGVAW